MKHAGFLLPLIAGLGCATNGVAPGRAMLLFDGVTLDGWVHANGEPVTKGWVVEDGCLHRREAGGDILTEHEFGDFELSLEWRIDPGVNSGVKYRVRRYGKRMLGLEYQVIDDARLKDPRSSGSTASLYALKAADGDKPLLPPGSFNHTRIVVRGNRFEHWLNGRLVVEMDTSTDAWTDAVGRSKFKSVEGFGLNRRGRILLQDHGGKVWFRNIVLRPLPPRRSGKA